MSSKKLSFETGQVHWNPSFDELKEMISAMPTARKTEFGNFNVTTKVLARSKSSTHLVGKDLGGYTGPKIYPKAAKKAVEAQEGYLKNQDVIVIEGYIDNDPEFRVPSRLVIEKSHANIAAMQKTLYFDTDDIPDDFEPTLTVIYTPNQPMFGFPNDRLIAVDLETYTTRVFNSDYFGESKKGGLRMWNHLVYERGGLALHAGCKVIPVNDENKVYLIVGLSGTGKTTTTFTQQNGSSPVQDDFVALMPGGKVYATENGCFAKTFGLNAEFEPAIHGAVTQPDAFLENVSQTDEGNVDFFDTSYTKNGRAVFGMKQVAGAADARELDSASGLLILNRNETIMPCVAKLSPKQAAAYFMLGETMGTSAGGKEEEGKNLRVPGTNPFFPMDDALQGNRMFELMQAHALDTYLMNTGRVGGSDQTEGSKKVSIDISSAVVKAVAEDTITWTEDPDFGYMVAESVPGIDDPEILQPRKLYERLGRLDEYQALVSKLKEERKAYFAQYAALNPEIAEAAG